MAAIHLRIKILLYVCYAFQLIKLKIRGKQVLCVARPVLVIPWIVIQELDSLKSDSWRIKRGKLVTNESESENSKFGVDTLARQAVRFLHTCFENNHPRLRGQTVSELQGIRSEFILDPSKVTKDSTMPSDVTYSRKICLFVSKRLFLQSDSWRIKRGKLVTNESESENSKFGVDTLARQAVRFLHTCFENNHPRLRGQTVSEAQEMMENCSIEDPTNDDKILQCCLLFQRKADVGHSVLFSNDQNLCSKAIINGLKAFNHKNLVSGLKELFQSSAVVLKQDYFQDYYKELQLQETLAEKRAKADDMICELQCVMREGLAVVVETEMRAAYEDLWDKIVFIKPPWTLADLLKLLDKHWIAVFGHVFKRSIKSTVEGLYKHFNGSGGSPGCLAVASTILDLANALFEEVASRSRYF
ncbi:PREDICTED: transcriptional protein SWT1-like [Acropora digitifera]|uniref:transcriptional protein SWT1-like n=1 Tax=Acropora digitifera TaxID=70779 RepID=UPI00077ABB98|nr:PREDICTED: transcriptional protein SWT1-like [Acropora digitifera]